MSHKVNPVSDRIPEGTEILTPPELNDIRFSKKHTVLTPGRLKNTPAPTAEEK